MKINKYQLPLSILPKIIEFDNIKSNLFWKTYNEEGSIITLHHQDRSSGFYFEVDLTSIIKGLTGRIDVRHKPWSSYNINETNASIDMEDLVDVIHLWENVLKEYDKMNFEDDIILKQYQEDFFSEFEIVDDGNNDKPLNDDQMFFLEEHLKNIFNHIDEYQNEFNEDLIKSIKVESTTLRLQLTSINKGDVIKKIVGIWSKMKKAGIDVVKGLLTEIKKEAISSMAKVAVEQAPHIIEKLLKH